jgi:hypothetical protein
MEAPMTTPCHDERAEARREALEEAARAVLDYERSMRLTRQGASLQLLVAAAKICALIDAERGDG